MSVQTFGKCNQLTHSSDFAVEGLEIKNFPVQLFSEASHLVTLDFSHLLNTHLIMPRNRCNYLPLSLIIVESLQSFPPQTCLLACCPLMTRLFLLFSVSHLYSCFLWILFLFPKPCTFSLFRLCWCFLPSWKGSRGGSVDRRNSLAKPPLRGTPAQPSLSGVSGSRGVW